jgi:peptide-methionine (S)-S-oxide reductase
VIFYHDETQKSTIQSIVETYASDLWSDPIVTQVVPYKEFWPADESQQNFYNNNPGTGYCQIIINPKIQKLRQKFAEKLLPEPAA